MNRYYMNFSGANVLSPMIPDKTRPRQDFVTAGTGSFCSAGTGSFCSARVLSWAHGAKGLKYLVIGSLAPVLLACSVVQPAPTPIARLEGRGMQWVSESNEFLGSNRAVQALVEASDDLRGFVERQGQPEFIKVPQRTFDHSEVQLFYPRSDSWYRIRYEQGGWFVEGPLPITPEQRYEFDRKPVAGVEASLALPAAKPIVAGSGGEPAIQERPISLSEETFRSQASTGTRAALDSGAGSAAVQPELPRVDQGGTIDPRKIQANLNTQAGLDALIHTYGKELAETTPKGDLVHYVTFPGETLRMVARWYTKDENNTERLARINELRRPNALQVGDMVVIPKYLVKNGLRMTEEAVQAMR